MIWFILLYPVLFIEMWLITKKVLLSLLLAVVFYAVVIMLAVFLGKVRMHKLHVLLDDECDIDGYEEAVHKMYRKAKQGSVPEQNYLLCQAVGAMCKGDVKRADELLNQMDITKYRGNRILLMNYYLNRIACYYALPDLEKAEALYETQLVSLPALNKELRKGVEIAIAMHQYRTGKKEESYVTLKKLLTPDLRKRQYLGILYYIALMDMENGKQEEAKKAFEKIVRLGNQLDIVNLSKRQLESFC